MILFRDVFNALILVLISIFDIRKFTIPNILILFLFLFNLLFDIFCLQLGSNTFLIKFVVMTGVFLFGFFLNTRYGLGMGDVKLLSIIGYIQSSMFFALSVFSSSICGIIYLIFVKKLKKKEVKKIPFAPFITIGTCIGEILRRFVI